MRREVILDAGALQDLETLFDWIADRAGPHRAEAYTSRLRAYCESFDLFPMRGIRRDDLKPGVRLIGFERRVTIAFTVTDKEVAILRILYGGRDIDLLTEDQNP